MVTKIPFSFGVGGAHKTLSHKDVTLHYLPAAITSSSYLFAYPNSRIPFLNFRRNGCRSLKIAVGYCSFYSIIRRFERFHFYTGPEEEET
jgi:hypothetical protein